MTKTLHPIALLDKNQIDSHPASGVRLASRESAVLTRRLSQPMAGHLEPRLPDRLAPYASFGPFEKDAVAARRNHQIKKPSRPLERTTTMPTQGLQIETWPIERLIPYARNARLHSEAQVAQIAASIAEFGFNNPILVGPAGGIIAGHARVLAARMLGYTEIPVIVLEHLRDRKSVV
jgi:hypothetical protein